MFTPTSTNPLLGVKMPSAETIVLNPLDEVPVVLGGWNGTAIRACQQVQMFGLRIRPRLFHLDDRFCTLAMADDTGAVYMTGDLYANLDAREPDLELDVTDSLTTDDDSRSAGRNRHTSPPWKDPTSTVEISAR